MLIHENELLKESIAKLSSEISTHSLVDLQVHVCVHVHNYFILYMYM